MQSVTSHPVRLQARLVAVAGRAWDHSLCLTQILTNVATTGVLGAAGKRDLDHHFVPGQARFEGCS